MINMICLFVQNSFCVQIIYVCVYMNKRWQLARIETLNAGKKSRFSSSAFLRGKYILSNCDSYDLPRSLINEGVFTEKTALYIYHTYAYLLIREDHPWYNCTLMRHCSEQTLLPTKLYREIHFIYEKVKQDQKALKESNKWKEIFNSQFKKEENKS